MNNLTNKDVVAGFFEIYNNKDYQAMYRYFVPNYYDHSLPQVRIIEDAIALVVSQQNPFQQSLGRQQVKTTAAQVR